MVALYFQVASTLWRKALVIAFVLVAQMNVSQAQVPVGSIVQMAVSGASGIIDVGKGQYQLPDQSWHPATMRLEGLQRLQAQEKGSKKTRIFTAKEIQALAAGTDTFRVLHNFTDPKKPERQIEACFVKQIYNRGGYLLAAYSWGGMSSPEWNGEGQLLSYGSEVVAIPVKREEFAQVMLAVVGDHPGLAKQLKAGELRAKHTKQIIALYVSWKQQPTH